MLKQEDLKADLKQVFVKIHAANTDADTGLDMFVDELSKILIKHIKTLEIKYTNGLTAPNGPVSGVLNHTVE